MAIDAGHWHLAEAAVKLQARVAELESRCEDAESRESATVSARDLTIRNLTAQLARATAALEKIDKIRDSIVGMQGFNFLEHAYPFVTALGEAGYPGAGYEIARQNLGTLIEQITAAEARIAELESAVPHPGDGSCGVCRSAPSLPVQVCEEHDPKALTAQLAQRDATIAKLRDDWAAIVKGADDLEVESDARMLTVAHGGILKALVEARAQLAQREAEVAQLRACLAPCAKLLGQVANAMDLERGGSSVGSLKLRKYHEAGTALLASTAPRDDKPAHWDHEVDVLDDADTPISDGSGFCNDCDRPLTKAETLAVYDSAAPSAPRDEPVKP